MEKTRQIAAYFDGLQHTGEFQIISEILAGIHRYVRSSSHLSLGLHPLTSILASPAQINQWQGDGVVGLFYDRALVDSLQSRGIAVVNLTENIAPGPDLPVVVSDNQHIGRLAAGHLLEMGYRRFGYIGMGRTRFSQQRGAGFTAALAERGISPAMIRSVELVDESPTAAWLAQYLGDVNTPVGILAADDNFAVRTLIAAHGNGRRVPQDIAIVGVNDLDLICNTASVPLTSVAPAYLKIGVEAARLLDRMLQGEGGEGAGQTIIRVPPIGVAARMSTQFLAFADLLVERAMVYIHANVNQVFHVEDVVRHCGKSRRTLELRFAATVAHSIHDEINRVRIERAKQLLADTEWTLGRVAEECGFSDARRMAQVFARLVGKTPKAYRRRSQSLSTDTPAED